MTSNSCALFGTGLSTRTAIQRHGGINNSNNKNDIGKKISLRLLHSDNDVKIFMMVINSDHERKCIHVEHGNEIEVTVTGEHDDDMCHCDNRQGNVSEVCSFPEHPPGQPTAMSTHNSEPTYWYYNTFVLPTINLFSSLVPAAASRALPGPEFPDPQQPSRQPSQLPGQQATPPPRKTVIRFNDFLPTKRKPRQSRASSVVSVHSRTNTSHATKAQSGHVVKQSNGRVNKPARNR